LRKQGTYFQRKREEDGHRGLPFRSEGNKRERRNITQTPDEKKKYVVNFSGGEVTETILHGGERYLENTSLLEERKTKEAETIMMRGSQKFRKKRER